MTKPPLNLCDYLAQQQCIHQIPKALSDLVVFIADACIDISRLIARGALENTTLASTEQINVQGEVQKQLDILSNDIFIEKISQLPCTAAIASEEMAQIYPNQTPTAESEYCILFDPLDGSSNIEVNVSIGTIFSILKKQNAQPVSLDDFLRPGTKQLAAGYVIYGPQTMLVLTLGHGVAGFTLDPFCQKHDRQPDDCYWYYTHPTLQIPPSTAEFAINLSNQRHWAAPVKTYIDELLLGKAGPRGKDFNMRWVASMVADMHRILNRGGIFMYPQNQHTPHIPGRLRLLFEANPLSFIVEQAGGLASNGQQRILNLQPSELHERVAVFLGAQQEVEQILQKMS